MDNIAIVKNCQYSRLIYIILLCNFVIFMLL